ncbi:MAG: ABC transporter ATP-binding protein, partial [Lachnospiraceae bacterium]|nr:ABC transporter ATP-binding protein [Lachnospiraceae bacterium]
PEFYKGKRSGKIIVDGDEMASGKIYELVGRMGTVFQNPRSQFFNVDTTSEIAFGCENLAIPEKEIFSRMEKTVSDFAIESLMDRSIFELSGGEKQKISCASVDVLGARIILLDEPSANLDYESAEKLRHIMRCWKQEGKTIVIAEHRVNYIWDFCDKVLVMDRGTLLKELSCEEASVFSDREGEVFHIRSLVRRSPLDMVKHGEMKGSEVIRFEGFRYEYEKGKPVVSVSGLEIPAHQVTALVGSNGAGKTTFLELVCGIRKSRGIMYFHGRPYHGKEQIKTVFMVMQDVNHQLFTESVLDEVLISQRMEDEKKAKRILQDVGLLEVADRHPMSLSGGQKQRLALACAIASEREILLLYEPTSGLDLESMVRVADILKALKKDGRTILTVTHDSEFIEKCCDAVVRL